VVNLTVPTVLTVPTLHRPVPRNLPRAPGISCYSQEEHMFMHADNPEPQSYVIYDSGGRPIGRVVQPRHEPMVGPGQETVLLVRPMFQG
jgi:hypothetical protein